MATQPTAHIAPETIVSTIDTEEAWFTENLAERQPLPGKLRVEDPMNALKPAQIAVIVRGLKKFDATKDLSFAEACDVARGRQFARLRGRQMDFNVVDFFANMEQQESADEPLTVGQLRYVDRNVKALLGTEAHSPEIQPYIEALSQEQRDKFVDLFEACETRGELSAVIARYERRVPNPRTQSSTAQSIAQEVVANLPTEVSGEEAF